MRSDRRDRHGGGEGRNRFLLRRGLASVVGGSDRKPRVSGRTERYRLRCYDVIDVLMTGRVQNNAAVVAPAVGKCLSQRVKSMRPACALFFRKRLFFGLLRGLPLALNYGCTQANKSDVYDVFMPKFR